MKKSIAIAITTVGIGFCANAFGNASGTQVNPSTINLSANGVTDVGIHTQLGAGECNVPDNSVIRVEVLNGGLDGGFHIFEYVNGDLSIGADSLGHLVISILPDAWGSITGDLEIGDTEFWVYSACDPVSDVANIVDNSGRQR